MRDFAKAMGCLAKTEALDASVLALFAERVHPEPRPLKDDAAQMLESLLTRRRQIVDMLTAEKHRLGFARVRAACTAPRTHGLRRNGTARDGWYRPQLADWDARGRRSRSRRNRRIGATDFARVQVLVRDDGSPEQVAGWLKRPQLLPISHEMIYRWTCESRT